MRHVDLHIQDNAERHHTDKYDVTNVGRDAELVVRRGEGFLITIEFDRQYNYRHHDLHFEFTLGE